MKRYGNLYQNIWAMENLQEAHRRASKGKRHYTEVQMVDRDPAKYLGQIQKMLMGKTFQNSEYTRMTRNEYGKTREILKLPYFPDRIIHHAIMNVLEPIWTRQFITDTWSSIKGRGVHRGVKRVKAVLRDRENTRYCLKMDVRKFYPSVDNTIMKQIIRRKIKDADLLWLIDEIIDSAEGLPIGNYLSQFLANLYLSDFDHYVKEALHCRHYFRYCDDLVILAKDKRDLHQIRLSIEQYLNERLNLEMKDNWQVFPVAARGLDFLGYRFFHDYTLIRKSIVKRFKRKHAQGRTASIPSYWGWFKWADTYNLTSKYGVLS